MVTQLYIVKYFSIVHSMEREYSGKKKLLSGVCHRLVNIGVEVDHLSHRIREKRHLLDNRRLQNQCVIERYEELNQQLNFYLNNVLQEPLHTEVVQPEMATTWSHYFLFSFKLVPIPYVPNDGSWSKFLKQMKFRNNVFFTVSYYSKHLCGWGFKILNMFKVNFDSTLIVKRLF